MFSQINKSSNHHRLCRRVRFLPFRNLSIYTRPGEQTTSASPSTLLFPLLLFLDISPVYAPVGAMEALVLKAPDVGETLSGVFGSVSLTAWICLLVSAYLLLSSFRQAIANANSDADCCPRLQLPQLITNYKAKSADGLSMKFLIIWLLGDIANLSGKWQPACLTYLSCHPMSQRCNTTNLCGC